MGEAGQGLHANFGLAFLCRPYGKGLCPAILPPGLRLHLGCSKIEAPENVYAYCSRRIRELGPEGFILQSGCDIPANAKLENVQAMVAAAVES